MDSQVQYTVTPPSYSSPKSTPDPTNGVAVEVIAPQQPAVVVQKVRSYVGHIALACVVLLFCNLVFGLVAFIFAGQYRSLSLSSYVNVNVNRGFI